METTARAPARGAWAGYLTAVLGASVVYLLLPRGSPTQGFLLVALSLSASAAITLGVAMHRPVAAAQWRILAAGVALYGVADLLWFPLGAISGRFPGFPSLVEAVQMGAGLVCLKAIYGFGRGGRRDVRRSTLDAALMATAAAGASWAIVWSLGRAAALSELEVLALIVLALFETFLLALLARLLLVGRPGWARVLALLAVGSTTMASLGNRIAMAEGSYPRGTAADLMGHAILFGVGIIALHPIMRRFAGATKSAAVHRASLVLLGAAALIIPVVHTALEIQDGDIPGAALAVLLTALALALAHRTLTLYREAERRSADLEVTVGSLRAAEEELRHRSFHDALTGLPNRVLFQDRLEHALARRRRGDGEVAILFLDLDGFKGVNDSFGHATGDLLLQHIADRLRRVVREVDTVARLGGDEFAIILEGSAHGQGVPTARRILGAMRDPFELAGRTLTMRVSIGVAGSEDDPARLMANADVAMYAAKEGGRNRYHVFDAPLAEHGRQLMRVELELGQALERRELFMEFQPIVDLATEDIVAVEALARWRHPDLGLVSPEEFIPLAERSGLIEAIDGWVLRTSLGQLAEWQRAYPSSVPLALNVNVAPIELRSEGFIRGIERALEVSGVDPSCLVLEMTESDMMDEPDAYRVRLERLKALGVRLAIDDFGTGYSSLAHLQRFPFDVLKIDRSFVRELARGTVDAALIRAVTNIGRALGLTVVAEGIERQDQARQLRRLGCVQGQGYHYARPMPPQEMATLLAERDAHGRRGGKTRVVIVDDHASVRAGVREALNDEPDLVVVGEAGTVAQALEVVAQTEPDVLVLDLDLPDGRGELILERVHRTYPAVVVVVLSAGIQTTPGWPGVAAAIAKDEGLDELIGAIRTSVVLSA